MATATFAERLNEAMKMRDLKQIDIVRRAQDSGVKMGKSHVSQYVGGKTIPRDANLSFLARTLDVDEAWLLGEDVPMSVADAHATASESPSAASNPAASAPEKASSAKATESSRTAAETSSTQQSSALTAATPSMTAAAPATPTPSQGNTATQTTPSQTTTNPTSEDRTMTEETETTQPTPTTRRQFTKSHKLDNVLYDVRGPVVDEAARMEAQGTNVLKLNIGNPAPFGFRTPDEVVYDMAHQLTDTEGYSPSKGLFSARKAIMQYSQIKKLPNVTIDDIYTGNGVSELINLSMSALLDDGDEVLVPAPDYPLWTACVTLAGGTAVHYVCDEQSEWNPDVEDMERKITDHTKAIVLINPNNPTGAVYPKEVLEQIVEVARRHQLMIFSDEIYDRLCMDGIEHTSIASLAPDLFCVTFSGLSKSHMIAGYRIGWMVLSGNKALGRDYIEGINMLSNMRICSNVPAQSVVQTALWGHQSVNDYIVPGGRIYEQREYIYNALNSIPGVSCVKPKAAFYAFPKLDKRFNIHDDQQFALDLLKEEKLLIVQGTGFNWIAPDHFRIVYLPRIEDLKDAVARMTRFLEHYRQ
ncbi:aspartate aminotransferase [Pseudoscardovia radai]|uniref:alanine transaminase n=2 Tax=Pseudoscardovia radai TaxID=987066 RepID=A0A261ER58_9BIFI|nr:aminotransferase class I/II-fold pyridoxal phosphate-dependent enzyme [Pseudoscardovia radai]OZG49334.1 aspartate aminotransferase [Pseudoscardovia radai]